MKRKNQPAPTPQAAVATAAAAAAILASREITTTECRECGTQISGINGRYSCPACGWSNPWYEGHTELPAAEADLEA